MKVKLLLARLFIGSCVAAALLIAALWIYAGIALQEDPWLKADIRVWRSAYADLSALPDFAYVSARDDGSFFLCSPGMPDQSAVLPEAICKALKCQPGDILVYEESDEVTDEA